jgi:hypothetical protein
MFPLAHELIYVFWAKMAPQKRIGPFEGEKRFHSSSLNITACWFLNEHEKL